MARREKQVSALTRLIDARYIPMDMHLKLWMGVFLLVLPMVVSLVAFYLPYRQDMDQLMKTKFQFESELQIARTKASRLQQLEKELIETKEIFNSKAALLPETKEIPKLLKDISALGTAAGLEFLSFKPMPEQQKDFYEEIPISISLKGPYHNIGHFFDSVSKLERIVSVGDIKVGTPTRENNEMTLKADCQLVTYRFTNEEVSKPQASAGTPKKK